MKGGYGQEVPFKYQSLRKESLGYGPYKPDRPEWRSGQKVQVSHTNGNLPGKVVVLAEPFYGGLAWWTDVGGHTEGFWTTQLQDWYDPEDPT